jgi:antitoxin (DNA-binding transcriptional repressor) of toxin-antitoxin stability system
VAGSEQAETFHADDGCVSPVKWFLAELQARRYLDTVKTATVQQVPEHWPDILKWVAAGEEVQMTDADRVVARLVPAAASQPDFLSRAKAVWGENPPGKSLSEIVAEARGSER